MKRITVLTAAVVAMAVGAAPASASLPVGGITQGADKALGGPAGAIAGDGGDASTGNTQVLNGNSAAVSVLGSSESKGGDTAAKSGDAYGGNGGRRRCPRWRRRRVGQRPRLPQGLRLGRRAGR